MSRAYTLAHGPAWWLACLALWLVPALAFAHPDVDAARRRYERAEFAPALESLDQALERNDLTRSDLLASLELRVLVYQAMDRSEGIDDALRLLAIVAPDHEFSPEVPPDVRARFEELRGQSSGPVRVNVVATPVSGGVSLEAQTSNDTQNVVRTTRVYARVGDGAWADAAGAALTVRAQDSQEVEYYADAVGPGGAPVASVGSREEPLRATASALLSGAAPAPPETAAPPPQEDDDEFPWLVVGIGGGVLAVGAVVLIVVLASGDSDLTQPSPPIVEF